MSAIRSDGDGKKGFTLIEIAIVLGVITVLALILTPTIMSYVEDAKRARAAKDVGIIAAAIAQLNKDTSQWPVTDSAGAQVDCLYTGPVALTGTDFDGALASPPTSFAMAYDHFMNNGASYPISGSNMWRGPYLSKDEADPWGTPYAILVNRLKGGVTGVYAWVLSAGPDGLFQTDESFRDIQADDIGILIQ